MDVQTNQHKMPGVGPPLSGSAFSFTSTVFTNLFVYMKHRRRRVIDLLEDYVELTNEVADLRAQWDHINDLIDRQSIDIERNRRHTTLRNKVSTIEHNFVKIKKRYEVLCADLDSRVRDASGLNAEAEQQSSQRLEDEIQRISTRAAGSERSKSKLGNESQANVKATKKQGSKEVESDDQTIRSSAANDNLTDIEKQKIWTRNFFKLARLDKDIVILLPKVSKVTEKLDFEAVTIKAKPLIVERLSCDEIGDFIPSHQKHLNDLLEYLNDQECKRIGIYGAPGVGTSNIMKNLNNQFVSSSTLKGTVDFVIWASAKAPNQERIIETVQEEIIERLKLKKGENRSRNAQILSSFLSKKKYVLLVDDFHPLVKLEDIGILEEHQHGKVVVAAKSSKAITNVTLKMIEIPRLSSPQEEGKFFKHFIDDYDELSLSHKELVHPIVQKLGGLPGMIKFTAKHLNIHRQFDDWKGVKTELQVGIGFAKLLGLEGLIGAYKVAYEDLRGDKFKKCLLYAALFPSRHKIQRNILVECWKAEDFLDHSSSTFDDARAEGTVIFTELQANCLLESCSNKLVKIPEFFRRVAFVIPFPEEGDGALYCRSGSNRDGHLNEEWENAKRVYLLQNNQELLPASPKCLDISTLFLQVNPNLKMIEYGFFINMKKLRVLNLHGTGITSLPVTISNLIALRSLYLNDCGGLVKLPATIEKLCKLEVLDVRGTSIACLPAEILKLVSLRCLRISFAMENRNPTTQHTGWNLFNSWRVWRPLPNRTWVVFPPDMHENLSYLEELIIGIRGEVTKEIGDIIKKEVAQFKKGNNFKYDLVPYLGQSSNSNFPASEEETQELSNVAEVPLPARITLSPAAVLQSNDSEISNGQNNTSPIGPHSQNAFPNSSNLARPSVTMTREDKRKGVAKPSTPRRIIAKPMGQDGLQGGIRIGKHLETIRSDTDDEEDEPEDDSTHLWLSADFTYKEQNVINYVFGGTDSSEILAKFFLEFANRASLQKFKPNEWLISENINIHVDMLTLEQRKMYPNGKARVWFLPDYFMISGTTDATATDEETPQMLFRQYLSCDKYGGDIHACEKIFILMNEENKHWYLCKIDLKY